MKAPGHINILIEDLLGSKPRVRILKMLASEKELTITSIINRARINYKTALTHLEYLKRCNVIEEKKYGHMRLFRYKRKH